MKTELLQLLDTDYDEAYIAQLKDNVYASAISDAFASENLSLREKHLHEKVFGTIAPSDSRKLANPYFIGFGNPNSDILVIGKEKAFPVNDWKLLIKESINNYRQWKIIAESKMFHIDQHKAIDTLGFNPLLPKSYHVGITKRNHTWSITSSIVSQVYPDKNLVVNESNDVTKSFFNNCFLTELNHIPAKYHEGSGLSAKRKEFLSHPFFKSFPAVIFSAKSYLKGDDSILKKIFHAEKDSDSRIKLDRIGRKKDKPLFIEKYVSDKQTIYVCNQLSGASGWSDISLTNFAKQISIDLRHKL